MLCRVAVFISTHSTSSNIIDRTVLIVISLLNAQLKWIKLYVYGEITKSFLRGFHSWSKIAITTSGKKSSNLVFETSQDHIQLHTKITSQNPITLWLCRSTDNLLKSKLPYCVDLWPQLFFQSSAALSVSLPKQMTKTWHRNGEEKRDWKSSKYASNHNIQV